MNKNRFLSVFLAAFCACAGIGLLHAADAAKTAPHSLAAAYDAEIPADDKICKLFVQVTNKPESCSLTPEGTPDLSGMLITATGIDADGSSYDILQNATLEEARACFQVDTQYEPLDPSGWKCKITFSVYSNTLKKTLSTTVSVRLTEAPAETTASAETTSQITTATVQTTTVTETTLTTVTETTLTTVTETTSAATVTETTTTVSAEPPAFLLGDCNADSRFDLADAVLFSKWLTAASDQLPAPKAADIDGSAKLNAADLTLMKRSLLGLLPEYPVKDPVVIDSFRPCTAKPGDAFSDWRFHVVIKHQYSDPSRTWTKADFSEIENIKEVTQYTYADPYRQLLEISLSAPSKESVLQMIQSIEALELKEIKEVQVVQDMTGDDL